MLASSNQNGNEMSMKKMEDERQELTQQQRIEQSNKHFICRICLMKSSFVTPSKGSVIKKQPGLSDRPMYRTGPTGKRLIERMTHFQRKVLRNELQRNTDWSQEKVEALAATLCIGKKKVYKWYWDQKNKLREAMFAKGLLTAPQK